MQAVDDLALHILHLDTFVERNQPASRLFGNQGAGLDQRHLGDGLQIPELAPLGIQQFIHTIPQMEII